MLAGKGQRCRADQNPLKRSDLDELESPAVASHPLRVNCYFGGKHGSQSCGYSGSRSGFSALIEGRSCKSQDCFGDTPKTARESRAHRRASCALPCGFGGVAGFAASPSFGGAPPADAGRPGDLRPELRVCRVR